MTKKNTSLEQIKRLAHELSEDIVESSSKEILAEAQEQFEDEDTTIEIKRLRDVINNALLQASKAKLAEAKKQVAIHKQEGTENKVIHLSILQKRSIIDRFISQDHDLQQKLTLAARKGEGIQTENDIEGMFEDMIELGVIDNQGNPK